MAWVDVIRMKYSSNNLKLKQRGIILNDREMQRGENHNRNMSLRCNNAFVYDGGKKHLYV